MGADGDRGLLVTGEEGPDVPDGIAFGRHADFLEELGQEGLRLAPGLGPADALRAGRATGSAVELTQVGYHAAGVDGRPGTHAVATGSRRRAWPRQCAPPPPSVNISRSGANSSRPWASICS